MVKLFYSTPAVEDLKNIYDYIAIDSKLNAKRFISLLKDKVKILKKYPESGKLVYPEKFPLVRQVLYKSYRIIYQLNKDDIVIITIHHQSRLPQNIPALSEFF